MGEATLARVLAIVSKVSGIDPEKLGPDSAIDQDVGMAGGDVGDLAEALAAEFGDHVWQWPWQRFATLDEGLGCFFLPQLVWQMLSWPFRESFSYPDSHEHLTLGHIAAVIDKGEWFEP